MLCASSSNSHFATASVITESSVKRLPSGNNSKSVLFVFRNSYMEPMISPTSAPNIFTFPIVLHFSANIRNYSQTCCSHSCILHFSISSSNIRAVLKKLFRIILKYSSTSGICDTNKKCFLMCSATSSESDMV